MIIVYINDKIEITKNLSTKAGVFESGTELKVVDIVNDKFCLVDENGNRLNNVPPKFVVKLLD